jgi:hypothetical protein
MPIVYQTTNLVNGKIYIGVHEKNRADYLGSGVAIRAAIRKYGKNSFKRETLFEYATIEEAYSKEREIVTEGFLLRKDVYNLVLGGVGGSGRSPKSLDTRLKMSAAKKGILKSPETKKKMSDSHTGKVRDPSIGVKISSAKKGKKLSAETRQKMIGRRHSEETRAKMSASHKARVSIRS